MVAQIPKRVNPSLYGTESAMLSAHLAKHFCHVMKYRGPLYLAKYLKASKLSLYKAWAGDPSGHGSDAAFISLSRSGYPRFILKTHRKVFLNEPKAERSILLARLYATALDAFKLIIARRWICLLL